MGRNINTIKRNTGTPLDMGSENVWEQELHIEELHNFYCSHIIRMIISRRMSWMRLNIHGRNDGRKKCFGKKTSKDHLKHPMIWWENIEDIYWKRTDWIYVAQGPDSTKEGNLLSSQVTLNFMKRTLLRGICCSPQTRTVFIKIILQ